MNDDDLISHSPLQQTVTRGDVSVEILIYRARDDDDWILEVEDARGGSTVWQESFATDQAALDEAMKAIEVEGIENLTVG